MGRGIFGPIRRRQYEPHRTEITNELRTALELVVELTRLPFHREVRLGPALRVARVGYTDAFFDDVEHAGLGFVLPSPTDRAEEAEATAQVHLAQQVTAATRQLVKVLAESDQGVATGDEGASSEAGGGGGDKPRRMEVIRIE